MADNKDIVELVIDAKNLTSDELNKAADDVEKLGVEARKTSSDLDKLTITKDTLESYKQLDQRMSELKNEIAASQVEYQRLNKEVKANKDATTEQRLEAVRQNENTKALRATLRATQTEQNKLNTQLRKAGVDTRDLTKAQTDLDQQLTKTKSNLKSNNDQLDKRVAKLRESVEAEKKSVAELKQQAQAAEKLRIEKQREADAANAALVAKRRETEQNSKLTIAISRYEAELNKLNAEKAEGTLSTGAYIRAESKLRNELKLTESQASVSRRAIEADAQAKQAATRSTDALTTVTRRLAQAYTVLVAAQTATAAISNSVRGYGELEAAITKVEKTTGNARTEVVAMAEELGRMAQDVTPTATTELLRYAEVAGQLGTKSTEDILNLVAAADTLNVSTNLAGDEAALLLARILGMTNQGIPAIQNLSSTVVDLGNNMKVAEDEIVNMTREIVTGTREIGLSAQASAALGATLAETGQQAERSRTAFFKLSNTIRTAVSEGGDELESLMKLTGQTADELEKNLGDRSEKIIVDFIQGLANLRAEGKTVSDVLKNFGIEGTEAGAVFSSLTDNVDVLEKAFIRADKAFVDGTLHIQEASKAYADQDAAIARLINKFNALQKEVGEAFADETDAAIRKTSQLIDDLSDTVIKTAEYIPQLLEGIGEMLSTLDNLASLVTADVAVLDKSMATLKLTVNSITAGLNLMVLGFQGVALEASELYNSLSIFEDYKIPTEQIDNLRERMAETKAAIERDFGDIQNAAARMKGESSEAFEDLLNAAENYGNAVGRLSEEQQKQLDQIIQVSGYQQEQEGLYRELTKAIVRANRELESEQKLRSEAIRRRVEATKAIEGETTAVVSNVTAKERANAVEAARVDITEVQKAAIEEQLALYNEQLITLEMLNNFIDVSTAGLVQNKEAYDKLNVVKKEVSEVTKKELEESRQLFESYTQGKITFDEMTQAQQQLLASYAGSLPVIEMVSTFTTELSTEQAQLNDQINTATRNIQDYQRQLRDETKSKQEQVEITGKLAAEQAKLNDLKQKATDLSEIESANYGRLQVLYREYTTQLIALNNAFKQGRITQAEYSREKERLNGIISTITQTLNINSDALDKNTEAIKRNKEEQEEKTEEVEKATRAVSLELEAFQYLSKEFDFNSTSAENLSKRYKELQGYIVENNRVSNIWYQNLAKISNDGFMREQRIIDETLAIRRWTAQVQSGNLSLEELQNKARAANFYFRELSGNQLDGLRSAISSALSDFQALDDAINDSLDDVEDRLDRIRGDEQSILKRQFERELNELLELREQAQNSGDRELLNKINDAIKKLKQAQQLEFKEAFDKPLVTSTNTSNDSGNNSNSNNGSSSKNSKVDVNVTTPNGAATITTADAESANSLIQMLASLGAINVEGEV